MAKGKGIVRLSGTIQGLTFYLLDGKQVVRAAGGGFNGEAIKTKASMVRVRENGSEFKRCMHDVAFFKEMLQPYLLFLKDGKLHQRLVRLFAQVKALDPVSARGQRNFALGLTTDKGRGLLQGFVLTQGATFENTLRHSFSFDFANGLHVPNCLGASLFVGTSATHFELVLRFVMLDTSAQFSYFESEKIMLDGLFTGDVSLNVPTLPEGHSCVVVAIGRFFQEVNGSLYPMANGVMEVVGCGLL